VPTADNQISFKVSGEGALIGVGNGDGFESASRDIFALTVPAYTVTDAIIPKAN